MIVRLFDHPRYAIFAPSYSNALRYTAKSVPGMRWDGQHSSWVGMPDAIEQVLKKLDAAGVKYDGELCVKKTTTRVREQVLRGLRGYQKEAVRFAVANADTGVLIALDVGTGKSRTAIHTARALKCPSIVVCPSFVRMVWRRELEKWRPKAVLFELWGVKPKPERIEELKAAIEAHGAKLVVVVHYDVVHAWVKPLIEVFTSKQKVALILDEVHALQSDRSRRSGACRDLAASCAYKIALSATPMTSRPRDLWNPVDTISPGRFGRPFDFYGRHCDLKQETITTQAGPKTVWRTDGASNLEELHERFSWFMFRRTKSEVALELPPFTRQVIELEVDRAHQRFEMRQVGHQKNDKLMREALSHAADGKLSKVLELVQSHLADGAKLVVFCHRVVIAQALSASFVAEGIDSKFIVGDISMSKREEIIDAKPDILCATMDSCSTGIDLTFASVALFVELDWVPSKLIQCLDAATEIMTLDGFKRMGEIHPGDLVAAFNRQTGEICYLPTRNVVCRALGPHEKMFAVRTDHVDLRVTAEHRMVYRARTGNKQNRRWSEWRVSTAEELSRQSQKYEIPVAGESLVAGVPLTDDELRFIGWFLTDGSIGKLRKSWHVYISQSSASPYLENLKACLEGCGMAYTTTRIKAGTYSQFKRRHDQLSFHIPRYRSHKHKRKNCGWDRLSGYLDKNFPLALRDVTKAQLLVLLEAIHMGDGSKQGDAFKTNRRWVRRTYHISSSNRTFTERLQQLCIERGLRTNIVLGKSSFGNDRYMINIRDKNTRSTGGTGPGKFGLKPTAITPGEYVWCVENDLGTLLVRRNGRTAVVGNCEGRLSRFGQRNNVLVQYLIALSTADEILASAVISKLGNFEAAIGKTDDKLKGDLGGTQKTAEQHLSNLAKKLRAMYAEGETT